MFLWVSLRFFEAINPLSVCHINYPPCANHLKQDIGQSCFSPEIFFYSSPGKSDRETELNIWIFIKPRAQDLNLYTMCHLISFEW